MTVNLKWKFLCSVVFTSLFLLVSPVAVWAQAPGDILLRPTTGVLKVLIARVQYQDASYNTSTQPTATEVTNAAAALESNFDDYSYSTLDVQTTIVPGIVTMPENKAFYSGISPNDNPTAVRLHAGLAEYLNNTYEVDLDDDFDREIIISENVWGGPTSTGVAGRTVLTAAKGTNLATVYTHEIGHTFDWVHADLWQVTSDSASEPPDDPVGCTRQYGDGYDTMGGGQTPAGEPDCDRFDDGGELGGHFGPWFKYRVDWLDTGDFLDRANILTITGTLPTECNTPISDGDTYDIASLELNPISQGGTKTSALQIPVAPGRDLWVYYRGSVPDLEDGVTLSWADRQNFQQTRLLDMTPETQGVIDDSFLAVGETFTETFSGGSSFALKLLSIGAGDAYARVCISGTLPNPDIRPVINVTSPIYGEIQSGTISYTATAYNPNSGSNNGDGIYSVNFDLYDEETIDDLWACLLPALNGGNPFPCANVNRVANAEDTSAPYTLANVDTTGLDDGRYFLVVWTRAGSGGNPTQVQGFRHQVDNTGP